jgi:hypothetical protein
MAGLNLNPGNYPGPKKPEPPTPFKAYPAAINQAGVDYDRLMDLFGKQYNTPSPNQGNLMAMYRQLFDQGGQDFSYTPYNPERLKYEASPDITQAMGQLKELGATGGLSQEDQNNLRARGVSPIRAVYANAMRDLSRQKAIQGGYSPGMNAATAKMAREQADLVGGANTNINASIAEMVQRGKLSAAPQYAQFAGSEGAAARDVAARNAMMGLDAAKLNLQGSQFEKQYGQQSKLTALEGMKGLSSEDSDRQMKALQGMLSLYGTTPALAQLFGNQVLDQTQLQQQGGLALIQALLQGRR